MKRPDKEKEYQRVVLNNKPTNVDVRIWRLFEARAGDKKDALLDLTGKMVSNGKSVERALADALSIFNLA